ncbi:late secretory pathway protein AVL9 homolog isoform X1 [Megalopta genalis]|uniref:late secretory pathway protein AVL9 homolog isoform X1 n=1 Tax=Megalopta genalis TaxID=115081 RepID=UPI00144339FD|nr:late secretory pathway protein AVL9 homolog isoform X1 [Megalopta genalis]XP_033332208.1 late secretory pathway protein AVL9 homolog isoform X1 [Megalopta genalis]XP_033332373.1 late secretory pathway protein AVL9 homolog isoform X3 [Megalopta genalis]
MAESVGPILHVIVVGFHHKKGCQVEYSFPPLVPGAPNECPLGWKYLPTLALPDGSHNYDEDTVYFHLPSLNDAKRTIYGISCFRQIPVEKLKNRTSDITRGTVQKSVCVLSTLPLYGHIQVKMALITHAYFEEGDFSKVSLLEDTYHHLNSCMSSESQTPPQVFVGLSARDFILQFRHKVLLLFKLLLLEKKIVFYQSPVQPLCAAILTLLSLFPSMIESGLQQAAYVRPSRPMSPIPTFEEEEIVHSIDNNISSINSVKDNISDTEKEHVNGNSNKHSVCINDNKAVETMEGKCMDEFNNLSLQKNNNENENLNMKVIEVEAAQECTESYAEQNNTMYSRKPNDYVHRVQSVNTITLGATDTDNTLPRDTSNDALSDARLTNNITQIAHINPELCGLPLSLFTKGYLCLPYLSLPYLDLLADVNVRGYIVGVTNVLFKQKKQLIDVLVEVENTRIETSDPELRRQLHLTTEDLRFADYIVRHVAEPRKDIFLDGVGWEGGDEWIRTQFRVYLLSMLRTSMQQDTRQSDHYNSAFIAAWRTTNNYKMWGNSNKPEINNIEPGHPFAGQLSVQDMKLRLSHTMQNTESGRKINQAMASTGRAVATTGKAVGGALSQAKGAFSNWWSTLTTVQPVEEGKPDNQTSNLHQTLSNMTHKTTIQDEEMNVSTNDTSLEVVID